MSLPTAICWLSVCPSICLCCFGINVRIFCLFYITVFFQMRIVLDKYVVYNFFSGEKNYS